MRLSFSAVGILFKDARSHAVIAVIAAINIVVWIVDKALAGVLSAT